MIASSTKSHGGWFDHNSPTGGVRTFSKTAASWASAVIVATCAGIGTGGVAAAEVFQKSMSKRDGGGVYARVPKSRTSAEELALVREVFTPSVQDLASIFKVSRQSIYNWLNGAPIAEENASKLHELAGAADLLAFNGVKVSPRLLKRKFSNGQSLYEVAESGKSTTEATKLLISILSKEEAQKEKVKARFANRVNRKTTADFDLPRNIDA